MSSFCILNVNRPVFLTVIFPLVASHAHAEAAVKQEWYTVTVFDHKNPCSLPFLFDCCFWPHYN